MTADDLPWPYEADSLAWLGTTDGEIRSALAQIVIEIVGAAVSEGISPEVASRIAERCARRICPPDRDLVPNYAARVRMPRAKRIEEIRKRFNGRNASALMAEFGISRATLYRYLKSR